MAQTYEYTLSLNDKMSSVMKSITGSSEEVNAKLKGLSETQKKLQGVNGQLGGDMEIQNEDSYFLGASATLGELVQVKQATIKKL